MTSDSAIPNSNSNNDVSQTDSSVTSSDEESTVTEVTFISSPNNVNLSSKLVEDPATAEDNSTVNPYQSVFDGTSVEENSTVNPYLEPVFDGTSVEENYHPTLDRSVGEPTIKENEIEQQIDDEINLDTPLLENAANHKIQVEIRSEKDRLVLTLPTVSEDKVSEYTWSEIWQQMKLRLIAQQRFFNSKINVHLVAHDRLLDSRQLQDIADTLSEMSLLLKSVGTSRRQTAIAAAGAGYSVEQLQPKQAFNFESKTASLPPSEALYLETTVRSGVEIRHRGSVIILGDVNPGGIVVADGDILIWGRLRGVAHAGAQGNSECTIMALQMEPTQLRIADALARAPEKSPTQLDAEVAYMTTQGIRITKANDFSRVQLARSRQEP